MQWSEFLELQQCLVAWYQVFCQHDVDRSGFIDANELIRVIKNLFGYQIQPQTMETILKRYSRVVPPNGRCIIAFDDFVSLSVRLRAYTDAFKKRDALTHGGAEAGNCTFAYDDSLVNCQSVQPGTWRSPSTKPGPGVDVTGQEKPFASLMFQLTQNLDAPVLAPPAPPEDQQCKTASDCLGNQGCCLRGRCSKTGGIFDQCYTQEPMNGRARSQGVWVNSDLCPCAYSYHCLAINSGDSHSVHGPRGFCMPAIG
ncbi:sorcin [Elysia marginata]|uniref:Sorcin n=1 Tax=Elysia marginata TaxID=1093978 RepID=A0AAV4H117_9GAST|nr:sorcin [Elysia marginata]